MHAKSWQVTSLIDYTELQAIQQKIDKKELKVKNRLARKIGPQSRVYKVDQKFIPYLLITGKANL